MDNPKADPGRDPGRGCGGHRRGIRWALSCLALVLIAGCAATDRADERDPFAANGAEGPLWIQIQNDNFQDARIYVHWGGQRRRIGMVVGKTTEVLEIEWHPQDFRLEVDLIAARGFVTDPLVVWPRETVFLQIPPR